MKRPLPEFKTDEGAEKFVEEADLAHYGSLEHAGGPLPLDLRLAKKLPHLLPALPATGMYRNPGSNRARSGTAGITTGVPR